MIRTSTVMLLVMALVVAVGCEKKTEERKPDVPVTGSDGTNTKGKGKSIQADIKYPPPK